MTKSKVYLIINAILCIALGILLVSSAVGIYREGIALRQTGDALSWIYTKEKAADAFAPIAPVFLGAVVLMITGLIMNIRDPRANLPVKDNEISRDLLLSRIRTPSGELLKEMRKEKLYKAGGWTAFGLCMVPVLLYLVNPSNFPAGDPESMFSSLMWRILPWTAFGFGCLMLSTFLQSRCIRRQISAAELQLKQTHCDNPVNSASACSVKNQDRLLTVVRIVLFAAALAMIAAGILNGSMRDVLIKAINLCTECVGLG